MLRRFIIAFAPVLCAIPLLAQVTNWTLVPTYQGRGSSTIAFGKGLYVATYMPNASTVDSTSILVSTNGQDWVRRLLPVQIASGFPTVRFLNGRFFLVSKPMLSSPDALNWTVSPVPPSYVSDIAFGNGVYVLIGDVPAICISSNADAWTPIIPYGVGAYRIAFGNGVFVACGAPGPLISSDGVQWSYGPLASSGSSDICYGQGFFLYHDYVSGTLQRSVDGINWTTNLTGIAGIPTKALKAGLGNFALLFYNGDTLVLTSPDAQSWHTNVVGVPMAWNSISDYTFTSSNIFIVGTTPPFVVSNPLSSPTNLPTALSFRLHPGVQITGDVGARYRIESSDDLTHTNWLPAAEIYLQQNPTEWIDPQPATGARFYRSIRLD